MPDFLHEAALSPKIVCGVDEAGRGPWAGPVVAAALIFLPGAQVPQGLNDSKKLSKTAREKLYAALTSSPLVQYGLGIASAEEIDQLNIWQATALAMRRAIAALPTAPHHALIDGNRIPTSLPCKADALIGGDGRSLSIAGASIIAKVTRDRMMDAYAQHYPQYGFERHAGYGTKQHQQALAEHGPCPLHRTSYAPIRLLLQKKHAA